MAEIISRGFRIGQVGEAVGTPNRVQFGVHTHVEGRWRLETVL